MNKFQFIELFAVPNRVTSKGVTAIAAPKSRIARGGNPVAERMIATSRASPMVWQLLLHRRLALSAATGR